MAVETESSLIEAALQGDDKNKTLALAYPSSRVTEQERANLSSLATKNGSCSLPIEWVVDVADNNLNWFIATAYSYDDNAKTLRVAIPDQNEPEYFHSASLISFYLLSFLIRWEGDLPLDHRMVHLIECCDGKSLALYKHVTSVTTCEVRWRVSWWIESEENADGGYWKDGVARLLGRLSNLLYVLPDGAGDNQLIEVGIDENLKLCEVLSPDGGQADFKYVS